jgi:hypothetical protein
MVHRQLHMLMKSRTLFFVGLGLLLFGIALYVFSTQSPEFTQTFPATANRECAPWDGPAFTVQIPWADGGLINISIWQAPEINFVKTFLFPDDSGQVGSVSFISASGDYEILTGEIRFEGVSEGKPFGGRFRLKSAGGGEYVGRFEATWGHQMMLCG